MKRRIKSLAGMLLVFFLLANAGWTQGRGKGKAEPEPKTAGEKVREVLPPSEPVFTVGEQTIIKNWFTKNSNSLPPGLAKRDRLPPGLEKQLQERGTLPPGLQKKIQPLPIEIERQLSPLPTGYRRVVIAGNVILMNPTTGLIYDIVRNVIP